MSTSVLNDGDYPGRALPNAVNVMVTGSLAHWFTRYSLQGADYSDWSLFKLYVDDDNYITAFGNAGASTITVRYRVGGVNYDITFTPDSWTFDSWHAIGVTWKASTGYLRAYYDGVEVGTAIRISSAISCSSATIYDSWEDATKPLFGRKDRLDVYSVELTASDFLRFQTARFT